ncbi:MAG: iron-sulfur cluster repair di-iron protein [Acidimicrobiales bacterium]|nr:iron-sulfur cluster repair di-iron protein [Acidimicrobiales bacterium]
MSTIDSHLTLAELVTTHPEFAAPLDALGLDFCCGGQQRLDEAVFEAGLDLEAVTAELAATVPTTVAGAEPEWEGMAGLVDHLESTHHAYLRVALPRLAALADKVAGVHGANHPELVEVVSLVREIRADLEPHLGKEEQVLFPMIRELAAATTAPAFHCGSLANPVRVMLDDHDRVGDLLAAIRAATGQYRVPDDGCGSYHALYSGLAELEADTHIHVHKENNELFPMVLEAENALTAAAR